VWLMAAHREGQDRVFGVVNVEPAFQQGGGHISSKGQP
jgi:5-deoxy-glucuronate isomerase